MWSVVVVVVVQRACARSFSVRLSLSLPEEEEEETKKIRFEFKPTEEKDNRSAGKKKYSNARPNFSLSANDYALRRSPNPEIIDPHPSVELFRALLARVKSKNAPLGEGNSSRDHRRERETLGKKNNWLEKHAQLPRLRPGLTVRPTTSFPSWRLELVPTLSGHRLGRYWPPFGGFRPPFSVIEFSPFVSFKLKNVCVRWSLR